MPESVQRHLKVISVSVALLAFAAALWLIVHQSRGPAAPGEKQLPHSIAEYRAALNQLDFGMFFVDFSQTLPAPNASLTLQNAKVHLYELLGRRHSNSGYTTSIGNLVADYSAVARKRISFGRSWLKVTNDISYDDSVPRTRTETLAQIESILRTNGGFIFPLHRTNAVLLTREDLGNLGHAPPENGH